MTPFEAILMLLTLPILAACTVGAFSEIPRDPNAGTRWEGKWFTNRVHALLYDYGGRPLRDRRRLAIYTLLMVLIGTCWLLGAFALFATILYLWRPQGVRQVILVALLFGAMIVWIRVGHRVMGKDRRLS